MISAQLWVVKLTVIRPATEAKLRGIKQSRQWNDIVAFDHYLVSNPVLIENIIKRSMISSVLEVDE